MLWLEIKRDQILHLEDRTEEKPKTDSKKEALEVTMTTCWPEKLKEIDAFIDLVLGSFAAPEKLIRLDSKSSCEGWKEME